MLCPISLFVMPMIKSYISGTNFMFCPVFYFNYFTISQCCPFNFLVKLIHALAVVPSKIADLISTFSCILSVIKVQCTLLELTRYLNVVELLLAPP